MLHAMNSRALIRWSELHERRARSVPAVTVETDAASFAHNGRKTDESARWLG
jgi:hypothetical protein